MFRLIYKKTEEQNTDYLNTDYITDYLNTDYITDYLTTEYRLPDY